MDFIHKVMLPMGLPFVSAYCAAKENVFLNTADKDANGLEEVGNWVLRPARYLLGGRKISGLNIESKTCEIKEEFPSKEGPVVGMLKTALSILVLAPSLLVGCLLKGAAYLWEKTRIKHQIITDSLSMIGKIPESIEKNKLAYAEAGIETKPQGEFFNSAPAVKPTLQDSELPQEIKTILVNQKKDIAGLSEVGKVLTEAGILWWADFGTALGVYRHNGMIPWDQDIDISILAPDHNAVKNLLKMKLDKDKYEVWDFSPQSKPGSILKIRVKETNLLIDVYHYVVEDAPKKEDADKAAEDAPTPSAKKQITYEFSHIHEWYIPEEALKREVTHSHNPSVMFPLKKAQFDGVEVFVPNMLEDYLLAKYSTSEESLKKPKEERLKELAPCRVWDPEKKEYAKVPDHPYFKQCAFNI